MLRTLPVFFRRTGGNDRKPSEVGTELQPTGTESARRTPVNPSGGTPVDVLKGADDADGELTAGSGDTGVRGTPYYIQVGDGNEDAVSIDVDSPDGNEDGRETTTQLGETRTQLVLTSTLWGSGETIPGSGGKGNEDAASIDVDSPSRG